MKTSNELRSLISAQIETLKTVTQSALTEKRDLKKCAEFRTAKDKLQDLKNELVAAEALETELRSAPAPAIETKEKSNGLGEFVKRGQSSTFEIESRNYGSSALARQPVYDNVITRVLDNNNPLYADARKVSTDGNSYVFTQSTGGAGAAIVAENGDYNDSSDLAINRVTIPLHKIASYPSLSEETVDQSNIVDLEADLMGRIGVAFSDLISTAMWDGTGTGAPLGILRSTHTTTMPASDSEKLSSIWTSNVGATPTAQSVFDVAARLRARYQKGAKWYMSRQKYQVLASTLDSENNPLLTQNGGNMGAGIAGYLAGYPIVISDTLTEIGTSKTYLMNAQESIAVVRSTKPLKITRDEVTKPGAVRFPTRDYFGFSAINLEAAVCMDFV